MHQPGRQNSAFQFLINLISQMIKSTLLIELLTNTHLLTFMLSTFSHRGIHIFSGVFVFLFSVVIVFPFVGIHAVGLTSVPINVPLASLTPLTNYFATLPSFLLFFLIFIQPGCQIVK